MSAMEATSLMAPCSSAPLPKTSPPAQVPKMCGRCGAPCACAKFCGSCFTLSCNTCMAEGEANCLHCAPSVSEYLVQQACYNCGTTSLGDACESCASPVCKTCMVEDQGSCILCVAAYEAIQQQCVDQFEQKCGNCGTGCKSEKHCYGCASTVCDTCMDDDEACCLLCLDTYPLYSSTRAEARPVVQTRPVAAPTLTIVSPVRHTACLSIDQLFTQPCQAAKKAPKTGPLLTGPLLEPLTSTKPPQEAGHVKRMTVDNALVNYKRDEIQRQTSAVSASSTFCPLSPASRQWSDYEVAVGSGESTYADETESDGDLSRGISSQEQKEATTMMICNIPCRLSQDAVIEAIGAAGFAGTYDFVYLPDRKNRRANGARTSGNIGYAFVNFKNMQHAESFALSFHNFQFPGTRSAKRCTLKYAHCQGFNAKEAPCSRRPRGTW